MPVRTVIDVAAFSDIERRITCGIVMMGTVPSTFQKTPAALYGVSVLIRVNKLDRMVDDLVLHDLRKFLVCPECVCNQSPIRPVSVSCSRRVSF